MHIHMFIHIGLCASVSYLMIICSIWVDVLQKHPGIKEIQSHPLFNATAKVSISFLKKRGRRSLCAVWTMIPEMEKYLYMDFMIHIADPRST